MNAGYRPRRRRALLPVLAAGGRASSALTVLVLFVLAGGVQAQRASPHAGPRWLALTVGAGPREEAEAASPPAANPGAAAPVAAARGPVPAAPAPHPCSLPGVLPRPRAPDAGPR